MNLFLFIDAARAGRAFAEAAALQPEHLSLYEGREKEDLAEVAPYLFVVRDDGDEFRKWFMRNGWGNSWGYMLQTGASLAVCRAHFQRFLVIRKEDGSESYCRLYYPRAKKKRLQGYDKKQMIEFFGPVEEFLVEGDTREETFSV